MAGVQSENRCWRDPGVRTALFFSPMLTSLFTVHRRLSNICTNFDMVLRLAFYPLPVRRTSMALAGKELGRDVGQWFGPSTAAGATKCVNDVLFCPLTLTCSSKHWFTISW